MGFRSYLRNLRFRRANPQSEEPVEIADEANDDWKRFHLKRSVSVVPAKIFGPSDRFFTIGSCFAKEVRKALTGHGVPCLPDYRRISFDPKFAVVDTLPSGEHMNYYNTFSIRQEFERAAGEWTQAEDDVWEIPGRVISDGSVRRGPGTIWQDPYRRMTFGASREILNASLASINSVMAEGIRRANAFIITLGLTEVFVKNDNGLVACQFPGYGRGGGTNTTSFHASSYDENFANMDRIAKLIRKLNPRATVIVTVSPVPLRKTFTGDDIVVANLRSKAILLAVAHEICRQHSHCRYFPSYNIATVAGHDAFQERDGRHVAPEFVQKIMDTFVEAYFRESPDRRLARTAA